MSDQPPVVCGALVLRWRAMPEHDILTEEVMTSQLLLQAKP